MDVQTGQPYSAAVRREKFLQKRRCYERARYWDESGTNVRKRRLERSARQPGKKRAKTKTAQLTLDEVARSFGSETYRPTAKLALGHDE